MTASGYDVNLYPVWICLQDSGSGSISSGWFHVDSWCDRYAGTGYRGSGASALQYGLDFKGVMSTIAVAFWLFIRQEYVIPVSKNVKNARRNVPLGMMIGLALICLVQSVMVLDFHNYTPWAELENSAAHTCYGGNLLGNAGKVWMTFVSALAVVSTQNSTVNGLAESVGNGEK